MNSVRLALVMLVCIAGLSAAQGGFSSCPSAQSTADDYFNAQASCTAYTTCATSRCSCNGGTYSSSTLTCSATGKTCAEASACERTFIQCLQSAAASDNGGCLASLKVAIVNVFAGTPYTGSALEQACKADTCRYLNATVATNCSIDYANVCYINGTGTNTLAPGVVKFVGRLTLGGDFIIIITSPTRLFVFILALNLDLTIKLQVQCNVTTLVAGSAIASFTANTAATDAAFLARLAAAAGDSSWLTNSATAFTNLGGTGTFSLLGIGAASGAATVYAWSALAAVVLAILA